MAFLAIDTSSTCCAVHLRSDEGRLYEKSEEIGRGHAEYIIPMIDEALETLNLDYKDITGIGVTVGPGNFTGVRVGLSVARGLGLTLKCPVIGVTALEAMGAQIEDRGLVAFDAKRGEVYAELFGHANENEPQSVNGPQLVNVTASLPQSWLEHSVLSIIGNGANLLVEALNGAGVTTTLINENAAPDIADVAKIAQARLLSHQHEAFPPKPLYLRAPDAKPQSSAGLFVRSA